MGASSVEYCAGDGDSFGGLWTAFKFFKFLFVAFIHSLRVGDALERRHAIGVGMRVFLVRASMFVYRHR